MSEESLALAATVRSHDAADKRCLELEAQRDELLAALKATKRFAELALGSVDFTEDAPGEFDVCNDAVVTANGLIAKLEGRA